MKNILFVLLMAFTLTGSAQNQKNSTTFTVYGNCEMCKERIEKAVYNLKGVKYVSWDIETQVITVKYNPEKVTLSQIHEAINNIGYKTDQSAADKAGYDQLPACCKVSGACEQ